MRMRRLGLALAGGAVGLGIWLGAPLLAQTAAPPVAPAAAKFLTGGYLSQGGVPSSLTLIPPPPAPGSAAMARDEEAAKAALALRGTPRWDLARRDADLFTPGSVGTFSCAAGTALGPQPSPHIDALLRRAARDLALAVYPTKTRYMRPRPFMTDGAPVCTPEIDAMLRRDGSYPSGHSAIGYGWGLILAEMFPARSAELVARGRAFGDSRRVCNVHWLSDVEEGRVMASAVVARLHAEPAFRADLEDARKEVAGLGAKSAPDGACAAEAATLAGV